MDSQLWESFPPEAIELDRECQDWREAVRASGELLVSTGAASDAYTEAVVAAVDEYGPYIVLAPGIAIAHARPEDGALAVGFSLVRLATPIEFGSKHNDPVEFVFAFSSPDKEQHISALASLADFIEAGSNLEHLRTATSAEEAHNVIKENAS
jgi:mannitol/fructose-specific phosphotransferase system IIA component (Ntr-type)